MDIEELKRLALGIIQLVEELHFENMSLKTILQNAVPRPNEPPLKQQLRDVMNSPENRQIIHQQLAVIYESLNRAAEEAEIVDLLARLPPMGEPN
ncbi:MAG TPA: hypothetical protein VHA33_24445 [Candidatus Angelobacter sp.]|nr:hypothetical protein [Candidatus Angelobacter sp.]